MLRLTSTSLLAFYLAYAASVSAQELTDLIGSLSTSCQSAAAGLLSSDFGTCANIMGLLPAIAPKGSPLEPLNAWIDGICTTPPCSESAVSASAKSLSTGCGPDAQKGNANAAGLVGVVSKYSMIRQAICLENKSNHTRCASALLAGLEKAAGKPLTISDIETLVVGGFEAVAPMLAKAPKDLYCNDCGHALYTTLIAPMSGGATGNKTAGGNSTASSSPLVTATCGASFVDGQVPASISGPGGAPVGALVGANSTYSASNSSASGGKSAAEVAAAGAGSVVHVGVVNCAVGFFLSFIVSLLV